MKSVEFLIESPVELPPDVLERLNGLLIKPLRDIVARRMAYPNLYGVFDNFDDIIADKKYAKSPRRNQAIELLFPYVVQSLDSIIKDAKANGGSYTYTRILRLLKYNIDNSAVAEVLDANKTKLLKILLAFVKETATMPHNVGRARNDGEIVSIIHALRNNVDWPELNVIYKHHFSNIYNTMLDAGRDVWGRPTIYNAIDHMVRQHISLTDLDDKLVNRFNSMKTDILNKPVLNLEYDRIQTVMRDIVNYYTLLERIGFDWPELKSFKSKSYTEQLNHFKTPIIREMLRLFKEQRMYKIQHLIDDLTPAVNWPELTAMSKSANATKPGITEAFTDYSEGDLNYATEEEQLAAVNDDPYEIQLIDDPSEEVQLAAINQIPHSLVRINYPTAELFSKVKHKVISDMLTKLKECDYEILDIIMPEYLEYLRNHNVNWPELDIIEKSYNDIAKTREINEARRDEDGNVLKHDVSQVGSRLMFGDYADAIRYMGEYDMTYADAPDNLKNSIDHRRKDIIVELLKIAKHTVNPYRLYRLMFYVKRAELNWPEIDVIYDSAVKIYQADGGIV